MHPIRQACRIELLVHGDGADAWSRAWTLNTLSRVKSYALNPSALTMPLTEQARTGPWIVSDEYNILWGYPSHYCNDRREDCASFSDEPAIHFATVLLPVIVIVNNHMPIGP